MQMVFFPNLTCPTPELTHAVYPGYFCCDPALTGLFQWRVRPDATCSLAQPSNGEIIPIAQATLLSQVSPSPWIPLSSLSGSHNEGKSGKKKKAHISIYLPIYLYI